jgi:hypothetical protein
MNWLGVGWRNFLAAVLGSVVGGYLFTKLRRYGCEAPMFVGLLAGVLTALFSVARSAPRGFVVASLVVWATAVADVVTAPRRGFVQDLASLHERLTIPYALGLVASAGLAMALASRAWSRRRWSQ